MGEGEFWVWVIMVHGDREGVGSVERVEDDKFSPPFKLELTVRY